MAVRALNMWLVIDGGALLRLDAPPPTLKRTGPAGLTWAPRVGAWRAPAWRFAELSVALANAGAQ
ncbi:MAG: hypothetical protein HY698_04175 [Deltaproteobacteria bacterium]|nr:hypothetical protein [Deltaproteobacteria bacterium]